MEPRVAVGQDHLMMWIQEVWNPQGHYYNFLPQIFSPNSLNQTVGMAPGIPNFNQFPE